MRITKPLMCCSGDKACKTRALVNLKRPRGVRIIKSSLPLKYDTSLEDSQTSGSLTFGVTSSRLLWWEVCWLPDSPKTALSFDVLPKMRHIKYFPCTKTYFFLKLGGESFPRSLCPQAVPAAVWQTAVCERSPSERLHICSSYAHWGQQGTGDHKPTSWFAPTPTHKHTKLSRWLTLCNNKKLTWGIANADKQICNRGRSFQLGKQELAVSHRNFIKTPRVWWEEGKYCHSLSWSGRPNMLRQPQVPHCSWSVNCERA